MPKFRTSAHENKFFSHFLKTKLFQISTRLNQQEQIAVGTDMPFLFTENLSKDSLNTVAPDRIWKTSVQAHGKPAFGNFFGH